MDIRQYIESGILEAYALGVCTDDECAEVERMAATHPEIKEALNAACADVERLAQLGAVDPSPALKSRILDRIKREAGASTPPRKIALNPASAIFIALAFTAAAFAVWFGQKRYEALREETGQRIQSLEKQVKDCEAQSRQLQQTQQYIAALGDRNTRALRLSPLPDKNPEWTAWVYHNPKGGYTLINTADLPPAPAGKSWQLWAIVNGTPQSMGVLVKQSELSPIDFVAEAQAFAISLEPEGGSPAPTEVVLLAQI
ncbi:MAG: anti-sigma factor domain-containing protein [Saprospiraceae bacterium]